MHEYHKNLAAIDALGPKQYNVTHDGRIELPFTGAYLDNHEPGIYVDVVSGEPLCAPTDKFESGTGWPSFTRPIDAENIVGESDHRHALERTDGPSSEGGLRLCINSAALRFTHRDDLNDEGYGQYVSLFPPAGSQARP